MTNSEIPPLPTQGDYLKAVLETNSSFKEQGSVREPLIRKLSRVAQGGRAYDSFYGTLGKLTQFIEPLDRSTGEHVNDDEGANRALMLGSAAGLLVIDRSHSGLIRPKHVFETFPLALPKIKDDVYDIHHSFSSQIRNVGHKGLLKIGDQAEEVVEAWESEVVDDVRRQYLFRIGLGIVTLGAFRYHERLIENDAEMDFKAFEDEVAAAHDFDWDAGAASLFDSKG